MQAILIIVSMFVVDLRIPTNVARNISFVGVGALLLIVGYVAPAPPRRTASSDAGHVTQYLS